MPNWTDAPVGWSWSQCPWTGVCCPAGHRSQAEARNCGQQHLARVTPEMRVQFADLPLVIKPPRRNVSRVLPDELLARMEQRSPETVPAAALARQRERERNGLA
jgi:hypothetical protein